MADMQGFGAMDIDDRGGEHAFAYSDERAVAASEGVTPSQTVGPFFAYGLTPGPYGYAHRDIHSADLAAGMEDGPAIIIEGQIFDGAGEPVHDAMIEIVQADTSGRYGDTARNDGFTGYGRCGTGANGPAGKGGDTRFRFRTVKPGPTREGAAPFLTAIVFMRGLLNHCITRIYFADEDTSQDPILNQVPEHRRHTLMAKPVGRDRYRFDIHMQGSDETVFFDI